MAVSADQRAGGGWLLHALFGDLPAVLGYLEAKARSDNAALFAWVDAWCDSGRPLTRDAFIIAIRSLWPHYCHVSDDDLLEVAWELCPDDLRVGQLSGGVAGADRGSLRNVV